VSDAREFLDRDVLSAYLDGECTDAERTEVEARLAESAEWRAELEEVRGARTMLRAVADRDAPAGFWDSVLATVAAADEQTDAHPDAHSDAVAAPVVSLEEKRRRRGRWVATAFAAAAAVGLAIVIVPHRHHVAPDVTAVVVQHGAQASDHGEPLGTITPVGPLGGFRR
jgi:anti-sigma factor RsiW